MTRLEPKKTETREYLIEFTHIPLSCGEIIIERISAFHITYNSYFMFDRESYYKAIHPFDYKRGTWKSNADQPVKSQFLVVEFSPFGSCGHFTMQPIQNFTYLLSGSPTYNKVLTAKDKKIIIDTFLSFFNWTGKHFASVLIKEHVYKIHKTTVDNLFYKLDNEPHINPSSTNELRFGLIHKDKARDYLSKLKFD